MVSVRFAPIRPPKIQLTPINFEVPHQELQPIFIGREWLFKEIEQVSHCHHHHHHHHHHNDYDDDDDDDDNDDDDDADDDDNNDD